MSLKLVLQSLRCLCMAQRLTRHAPCATHCTLHTTSYTRHACCCCCCCWLRRMLSLLTVCATPSSLCNHARRAVPCCVVRTAPFLAHDCCGAMAWWGLRCCGLHTVPIAAATGLVLSKPITAILGRTATILPPLCVRPRCAFEKQMKDPLTSHASERLKLVFEGTNSGHGCVHGGE